MPCPICDKPSDHKYTPFCGKRCEQIDLGKWLTGRYAVPVVESEEDEEIEGWKDEESEEQ